MQVLRGHNIGAVACGYFHAFFGVSLAPSRRGQEEEEVRQESEEVELVQATAGHRRAGVGGDGGGMGRVGVSEDVQGHGKAHIGARVQIVGLSNRRELNGQSGRVLRYVRGSDDEPRVCVLVGFNEVGVRPANLAII